MENKELEEKVVNLLCDLICQGVVHDRKIFDMVHLYYELKKDLEKK